METLVVIGAGSKGIAIAAKWTAYRALGCADLPVLIIIDGADHAGAHWDGTNGFTDGHRFLCTAPTHDLGYPYLDKEQTVREYMQANFSWQAYQTELGRYHQWIDKDEPRPTHMQWQLYLQWARNKCNDVRFVVARVTSIRAGHVWTVVTDQAGKFSCKRLVVTGPGEPTRIQVMPPGDHQRILDGRNFWHEINRLNAFFNIQDNELEDHSLAVIGSGGTAATIVAGLIERTAAPINVVSRSATLYARSESYFETKLLSNPDDWTDMPLRLRRTIIKRIDRGVISSQNIRIINNADNVMHQRMSVARIEVRGGMPVIIGAVENFNPVEGTIIRPNMELPCDFVIDASGFNLWWFAELFVGEIQELFADIIFRRIAETFIDHNLGLPFQLSDEQLSGLEEDDLKGLAKTVFNKYRSSLARKHSLHLATPMLAGLAQGPGFPNLTCLGLLSTRILEPFLRK